MFGKKKRNGNNPRNDKPGKGKKKADFGIEPLEKRVLMSASWVDADSGDAQDGPTHEADTFHGSDMADTANGGNGNDILFGNGGNDILSGSHGNDQLYGGDGNDTLDSGTGEDQLFGGSGDDVLQGGDQQDHLVGGDGNDTLDGGTDNDNLIGGSGHDNLIGGHGDDYLDGGSGNDTLDGGTGHDTIIGGDGDDTITGDHGDDVITGGKGNDTIDAGTGNDVINYTVGDGSDVVIGDWGTDRIEINGDASSASHVLVEDAPTYTARTGDVVNADRVVISVNGVKSIEAHGIEEIQFNSAHEGDTIETSGVLTSVGLSESNVTIVDPPEPENTAPTDLTFTGGSVTENAEAGTLVAVVSAVDADSDDVHAYELIDDAGGRFEIDSATGEITVADGAQLNHEAAGSHSVTVRVTDSDGAEYEESLSIGVTDANEAPTDLVFSSGNPDFVLSAEQVAEALPEGATATEYTVSGVPEGASLSAGSQNDDGTWTVSADQVDGLRVVNADPTSAIGLTLSADVVGSESVTTTITASNVRDTDAGFTVTARSITNDGQLTEASADNVVTSGGSFAVNGGTGGPSSQIGYDASKGISEELVVSFDTPMTSVQANISRLFTDEAGSCEQGEWVAYRDGVEVASSIFIATQNNAATLDIDAGGEEFDQVVFRATEYTGGQNGKTSDSSDYMVDSITFDREVTTVTHYDIPVTIEAEWGEADTATVVENAQAGTVVATMSVSDPDAGDTHSFELVGNADGRFEIDAATGAISVAEGAELDHESADAHELTVRVTDANGQTYDEVLSISVKDSNEAPTDLGLSNSTVAENAEAGTVVGSISVTDQDAGDTHTFELADDAGGRFEVDSDGNIVVAEGAELDYEAASEHEVTVRVTDSEGLAHTETFTIQLSDTFEGPELTLTEANGTEDAPIPLSIDIGAVEANTEYEITVSNVPDGASLSAGTDNGDGTWTLSRDQLQGLSITPAENFNGTFELGVEVNASQGSNYILNESFNSENSSNSKLNYDQFDNWQVTEGTVDVIGNGSWDMQQGNGLYLDMDGSTGNAGTITLKDPPTLQPGKYEVSFDIAGNGRGNQVDVLSVAAANGLVDADFQVEWDNDFQTATLVVEISEPTSFDLTFSHSGGDNVGILLDNIRLREVDADTPAGTTMHDSQLPEESGETSTASDTLVVNVTPVNDSPESLGITGGSVAEDATPGTTVATVAVSDPDSGDTHTFELTDDAGGRFDIDADGNITLAEGADLDHETAGSHEVSVRVTDSAGSTYEQAISIEVADVNEAPTEMSITGGTVSENAAGGTFVASASVNDPDANDSHTYELTDDAGGRFVIDQDGNITVADGADLNYESETSHQITVKVTDEDGETIEDVLEVSVANVMETLVVSGNETLSAADGPFEHVVINGGYIEIDGDAVIEGDLTITSAARINGGEISVTGNVTTTDTNYHGSAMIVLSGDGAQSISTGDGAGELHNVSITNTSGQVAIEGDLQISGSYTGNGNAVDATGATVELQGNASVSGEGTSFGDVTLDGGYFEISEMHVDGDLNLESAARINGGEISVTGNVTTTDTNYHGSATIVLSGDGAQSISTGDGAGELHNVSITNTSGQVTIEGQLEISGSYTDNGNAVDATGATVELQGNASVSGAGTSFGEVTLDGGYFEISEMHVDGDLTLESAARINGGEISVTGNVTTTDTNYHGSATIVLSGDGAQTISTGDGAGELHNVSITNTSGQVAIEGDLQISGSYTDNGNAVDATGATVELQGNASVSGEGTSFGEVTLDGGYFEISEMHVDGDLTLESAARINGGEISVTGNVTTTDTNYHGSATIVLSGDGAQSISTGDGAGELHNVSITNTSGQVTIEGQLEISGSYTDNGNAVDATGATVELQGNASVSGEGTSFGDVTLDGGYFEISEMHVDGDLTLESAARINGGEISVTGNVTTTDTNYHGSATIVLSGDGAQTISTGDGAGELHNVSITNTSGQVAIEGDLQISGSYTDNGNAVDATGATVELQGNASVSGAGTSFGDLVINGGYMELDGDIYVNGDVTVENLARLNGGVIYVAGEIIDNDGNWHGTGSIQPWITNEAPSDLTFEGGSVNENAVAGTVVATAAVTDSDVEDSHSYELVNDADGRFEIDAQTGVITVADGAELDHESADAHEVTVRVTDSHGETYEEALNIAVADVNEAPTAIMLDAEVADTNVLKVTIGGQRGGGGGSTGAPNYQIVVDGQVVKSGTADWMDMTRFSEQDSTDRWHELSIELPGNTSPDRVEVRFTNDSWGGSSETDRNLYVDNIQVNGQTFEAEADETQYNRGNSSIGGQEGMYWNGSLQFNTADAPDPLHAVVSENAAGAVIGQLGVIDPDANDEAGYAVSDARFEVTTEGVLKLRDGVTLDHEAGSVVEVEVIGTDSAGNEIDATFRIGVADVNDTPDAIAFTGGSVSENAEAGTPVASVSVMDQDAGDSHTYELTDDAGGRFTIDAEGNIAVAEGADLDHESAASHEVTVKATDSAGNTIEQTLTIEVGDVNEGPEAIRFEGGSVSENAAPGTVVATASVSDVDAGDTHTYELTDDAGGRFTIDAEGNIAVADGAVLDHESAASHEVAVQATDSAGNTIEQTLTIEVGDVNETPDALAFTGGIVQENAPVGTVVATVSVSDVDASDTHTYELVENADGRFVIDGSGNIVLAEGGSLDYESASSHQVTVRVTDAGGNSIEQGIDIDVSDVNENQESMTFTGGKITENAPAGTVVASANVIDPDAGDTQSFELTDDAGGRFMIDAESNIAVAEGAQLDHESAASHEVTVKATDSAGNTIEQTLTIEVGDVNEAPESISFEDGSVAENASAGTVVATASVSDVDAGDTHTYELTDDAGGRFTIDAEGNITVAEGADLDHESVASHEVTVKATDSAGNTIEQTLTIEVGNVNEAPESISFEGGSVAENASAGTVVATASVSDVDAGDTHTYELTDDAGGRFTIDAEGNIIVGEGANLDHESAAAHQVTVKITDSAGHTIERGISIEVADVNEAMESLTFSGGTIAEDAQAGTIVASASVTDPDAGETFSYELTDDADGRFTIDADGNIVVSTDGALDFESAKSHEVTVRVTDSAGHTIERTLTIEITNINEPTSEVADSEEAVQEQQATSAEPVQFEMQSDSAVDGSTQADRSEFEPANYAAQTGEAFEMQAAADTLKWVAAEVDELNELAKSVDAAEIHFSDSTASGGQASFEEVFARANGPDEIDEPTGMAEETPEYERASDGFIGKFWTMLRAGFGTTNRADESQAAGVQNDKALRNRSRQK